MRVHFSYAILSQSGETKKMINKHIYPGRNNDDYFYNI